MKIGESMSMKAKLVATYLLVGGLPVAVLIATISIKTAGSLRDREQKSLSQIRDSKAEQIEEFFTTMRQQLAVMAASRGTTEAMLEFSSSYKGYFDQKSKDVSFEKMRHSLKEYYVRSFGTEYEKKNRGTS